jgi:GGDEF domain-containing protein
MSLKFIGGVSKKLGSADRDLLEVSCQIEIEFDDKFSSDADDLQHRVEQAYAACRKAVEDELGRNLKAGVQPGAGRAGTMGSPANIQSDGRNGLWSSQKQIDFTD